MAKLSARGRVELARVSRTLDTPNSTLTSKERYTKAYMSDGRLLTKLDVWFRPDRFDPDGRFHSYGWKDKGKLKPEVWNDIPGRLAVLQAQGWTVERLYSPRFKGVCSH